MAGDAQITVSDPILFNANTFLETVSNLGSVILGGPIQLLSPGATITNSAQGTVTMCDPITIALSSFSIDGGRPLRFTWRALQPASSSPSTLAQFLGS